MRCSGDGKGYRRREKQDRSPVISQHPRDDFGGHGGLHREVSIMLVCGFVVSFTHQGDAHIHVCRVLQLPSLSNHVPQG